MKRIAPVVVLMTGLLLSLTLPAEAHRSGCHRWHSCPSDSGSYTCGDTGYCSGCPNNNYCYNGSYSPNRKQVVSKAEPSVATLQAKIKSESTSYYKSPQGFREALIKKLNPEFSTTRMVDFYVYKLLPDVK